MKIISIITPIIMFVGLVLWTMPKKWYKNSLVNWSNIGAWMFIFSFGVGAICFGCNLLYAIYKLCTVGIIYYF